MGNESTEGTLYSHLVEFDRLKSLGDHVHFQFSTVNEFALTLILFAQTQVC